MKRQIAKTGDELHIGTEKNASDVLAMSRELGKGLKPGEWGTFRVYLPDIAFALIKALLFGNRRKYKFRTLLLPATRHLPSDAIVTDRIGTFPAGACIILFNARLITLETNILIPRCKYFLLGPTA